MWSKSWSGLLLKSSVVAVYIIGAPIACEVGVKDTWRDVADWAAGQLEARFGKAVQVEYFDLFTPDCPHLPADVQLPLVLVNGEIISSGDKISIPRIRKRLEAMGISPKD